MSFSMIDSLEIEKILTTITDNTGPVNLLNVDFIWAMCDMK